MNEKEFVLELKKLNINCTDDQLEKLRKYHEMLLEWNQKFNLTNILVKEDVYLKHFYDSLTIVKVIDLNNFESLIDIGTGAGFPGIVLKIFYPHLKITLLEANTKKTTFLKEVCERLSLSNIFIENKRCEVYAHEVRENFDIAVARAVADLRILLELCIPLIKIDGYFIAMKGSKEEDVNETLEKLFAHIEKKESFVLPFIDHQRTLFKIRKEQKTEEIYPRNYDKIRKKPLKKKKS